MKKIFFFLGACLWLLGTSVKAQTPELRREVDTLSFRDRLAFRTNLFYWVLASPNIGMEWNLGGKNWSRWTVGADYMNKWRTHHSFTPGIVFNHSAARLEVRNYWRPVKHPKWTLYRGLFVQYSTFSYLFGSRHGIQGKAMVPGLAGGFQRSLYVYPNGNSIDFDLGLSVGACYVQKDRYHHDTESDCYPVDERGSWHWLKYPVLADVRAGIIFRMGRHTLPELYRRRYDVDLAYAEAKDSINLLRKNRRFERHYRDSVYRQIFDDFEHYYDSISHAMTAAPSTGVTFVGMSEPLKAVSKKSVKAEHKVAEKLEGKARNKKKEEER